MAEKSGSFQIPAGIRIELFGPHTSAEALYVRYISDFLEGTSNDLNRVPTPWFCDLAFHELYYGGSDRLQATNGVQWYACSMRMRRLVLYRYYEILRVNRAAGAAYGFHPLTPLGGTLRVPASYFPILPDNVVCHPLTPDVASPSFLCTFTGEVGLNRAR